MCFKAISNKDTSGTNVLFLNCVCLCNDVDEPRLKKLYDRLVDADIWFHRYCA